MKNAAEGELAADLAYTEEELVSADFRGDGAPFHLRLQADDGPAVRQGRLVVRQRVGPCWPRILR